ncbi:magnesium and cobalt transporter [Jannaschia seohaensis]|uniref:Magnesium and cobalt transporter n=2 Tax=Jannaschia seohaensis TaxID=475081 RepID=A0A2Y9B9P1_9RHOB|nr:magnesium and cobalt transporter [Jannaschia seohaensis]SSA51747.1 magnesium and cobalt transporter [Jannaschia seohaensis]
MTKDHTDNGAKAHHPGLLGLQDKRLDDVLIPRAEVVAVPADIDLHDLVATFRSSGMTRLPVFETTLDEPVGMIHLKDLALNHGFNGDREKPFDIRPLIRPLIYAPPSMPVAVLLTKMQTQRIHMALVIDEYGGVDGLVTLEDLIEQVIGEIEDEHDQDEGRLWRQEKSGCYLALARTPLDEFEDEIGFALAEDEDQEEIDTLGGLVFMLAGRVPERGEVIPHPSGMEIEVVDADPRRIKRLRLRMPRAA